MAYYLVALAAYLIPYAVYWRSPGGGDWDVSAAWVQVALWWHERGDYSVAWNPFFCGGYPLAANFQLPLFHAAMPLYWIFGAVVGLKMMVLVWMSAGFWLAFQWGKDLGLDRRAAFVLSTAWVLNGFFVGHLGQMHAHFVCYFLVPGLFLTIRRWLHTEQVRYLAAFAALLLVSTVHSYSMLTYFMPGLPLYFLLELFHRREKRLRLALPFFVVLALCMTSLSFFIVPAMDYLREFPRTMPPDFENPLKLITYLFFPGVLFPKKFSAWDYQIFIGPVLFWFLLRGLRRYREIPMELRPLLIVGAVHLVLAMGSFRALGSPIPSPFDLARELVPGYSSLRVPSRFLVGMIPGVLALAVWQSSRRLNRALIFLILAPLVAFQLENSFRYFQSPRPPVAKKESVAVDGHFAWARVNPPPEEMYATMDNHTGIANCTDPTPLPRNNLPTPGPLVVTMPATVQWERLEWDRFRFRSEGPGEALLTMSYHRNWRAVSTSGPEPKIGPAPEGFKVLFPASKAEFELVFEDPALMRGRKATAYALTALIAFLGLLGFRAHRL